MAWELNGNADATATSFLGPTNTQPLIVKTTPPTPGATPLERLRVTPEGRVGIGIINPSAKLTVAGGGAIINNVAIGTDGLSVDYPNEQETIGLANPGTSAVLRLQSPNGLAFHTGPPGTAAADNLRMTITPSGEVGIGKAPTANYKLEVAGIVNATDYHKNGSALVNSQWKDVTDGISYGGGNVGIGTTTPNARLSVLGPGATEILGTARSSTLLSSAGRLGATAGDELALASIGFATVNNNVSLGIRGRRAADGPDWPTTAIGLGMDVDDTVRAGASLWLHANGNVGIGTLPQTTRLSIASTTGGILVDSEATDSVALVLRSRGTGWGSGLQLSNTTATTGRNYGLYAGDDGSLHVVDATSGADRLLINNDGNVGIGSWPSNHRLLVEATSVGDEWVGGVDARAFGAGTGPKYGIWATTSGGGQKTGGLFQAITNAGGAWTFGQQSLAFSSAPSTGPAAAIYGDASGDGTGQRYGIYARTSGGGQKAGGLFQAITSAGGAWTFGQQSSVFSSALSTGPAAAIYGDASGDGTGSKYGIYARTSGGGTKYGGRFEATSPQGVDAPTWAVFCTASGNGTGPKYGVYAEAFGNAGTLYAGWFQGKVRVQGSLETPGAKAFLIDHPLDPENKTLRHNSVESPENLCLYRGKVKLGRNGRDTVRMPNYFAALVKEDETTTYLTLVGEEPSPTSYKWNEAHTELTIFGTAGAEVAYLVLADRDDPTIHLFSRPVEEEKGGGNFEKSKLLSPEAFDQPVERGVAPLPTQEETIRVEPVSPGPVPPEPIAPEMPAEVKPEGSDE